MSKKEQNGAVSIGDISTIRTILMGEHIAQFEERFARLEQQLAQQSEEFSNRIKELDAHLSERLQVLENDLNAQGAKLGKEISDVRQEFKGKLGQMLVAFGQGILGEE